MPERPSLEAQIDDDEAWLAANDDDDWDAPAAPPAPAAAPEPAPAAEAGAGAGRSRPRRARRRRSAQSTRRSPRPRSAFMIWRATAGDRSLVGGGSTCVWWKSEIRGNCGWRPPTRKETSWPSRSISKRSRPLALHEVQGKPSSFAKLARVPRRTTPCWSLRFVDATAAQAFDRALQSALRRVSSCAPPQELLDGVEPQTSFDTALKQLKAMGFDETSIQESPARCRWPSRLVSRVDARGPENEEPEAQPPSNLSKRHVSDIPWDDVEAAALRILAQSQNSPIPERLKHASKAATDTVRRSLGPNGDDAWWDSTRKAAEKVLQVRFDAGATSRGAAHAVSSHLRDVLDKIAVEEQPMSPLTDDAGVEEEKNEDSPERQLASPGASRRVSMASPVVSPAPAPAPRRRGTLGLDGNTPVKPPPQKRKSLAGRLAAMFKSPAKEKKKTSRAPLPAVPTPPSIRAARRAGLPPPPPRGGSDRTLSLQPFSPSDFAPKRIVGRGAFGVVVVAERKSDRGARDRVRYAIKVIDKASLRGARARALARIERDVLDLLAHRRAPFVAKLRCAFQSMERLYLAMDYYPAGSLDAVLASRSFRRSDARQAAQKVGAELAAALTQIHAFRVVTRVEIKFRAPHVSRASARWRSTV